MNLLLLGITLGTAGKVLLGITVIRVHSHLATERKVDRNVVKEILTEKRIGLASIALMLLGYAAELSFYLLF